MADKRGKGKKKTVEDADPNAPSVPSRVPSPTRNTENLTRQTVGEDIEEQEERESVAGGSTNYAQLSEAMNLMIRFQVNAEARRLQDIQRISDRQEEMRIVIERQEAEKVQQERLRVAREQKEEQLRLEREAREEQWRKERELREDQLRKEAEQKAEELRKQREEKEEALRKEREMKEDDLRRKRELKEEELRKEKRVGEIKTDQTSCPT